MAMIAVAVVAVGVGIYAATRTVSVPGQKLGEIAAQTAKEGEPRLIVWGTVRPIGGNLVAVQEPPRIERRKHKSGGKGGGGGSSTTTEHPHRTYAIGICEGPITGIRRVWRNNKLVYDGRPGSTWGAKNNGVFLRKARFFLGGYDQMPSADLEKIFGVGNVPAMRGTAYMVMADEDLSDMGGAVPQWLFEVVRAEGFYLSSRPYVVELNEYLAPSATAHEIWKQPDPVVYESRPDAIALGASVAAVRVLDGDIEQSEYLAVSAEAYFVSLSKLEWAQDYLEVSAKCFRCGFSSVLDDSHNDFLTIGAFVDEVTII